MDSPSARGAWAAWAAAHGLTPRWSLATTGSWIVVWLFAAVSVPLKYPYEAAGTVVDSGAIVGLVVPTAVGGTVLYEGPRAMVLTAARDLQIPRSLLVLFFYAVSAGAAFCVAVVANLPPLVVTVNALLLAALLAIGVSAVGVALGWILPAATTFAFSAPGLVPWDLNALYQRDVGTTYTTVVALAAVAGLLAYSKRGSHDRLTDRHIQGA